MAGQLINFSCVAESDGSLCYVEGSKDIPFDVKRLFYIFDVPKNEIRANHANTKTEFVLIAISGVIDVELIDEVGSTEYTLDKKTQGLYVPKMTWMKTSNFSADAILLVIASALYEEGGYVEDYKLFLNLLKQNKSFNGKGD